jgi:hypothetical protein
MGEGPNPGGFCMCGCGARTPLAPKSSTRNGWIKNTPMPYLRGHSSRFAPRDADYVVDESGCWIWQRSLDRDGYGQTSRDGECRAHVWMYQQHVGPVPPGRLLHHRCEVKACVNPAHLEPMTPLDHTRLHREACT